MTYNGYFILSNKAVLCVGITDAKLPFCHVVSYQSKYKKIPFIKYNYSTVYDCFGNHFPVYCGIPYLNILPIPIYDSPRMNKRSGYTPDMIPYSVYVASGNYISTFTAPSETPQVIVLTSDSTGTNHIIMRDKLGCSLDKIGCCSRRHDIIR